MKARKQLIDDSVKWADAAKDASEKASKAQTIAAETWAKVAVDNAETALETAKEASKNETDQLLVEVAWTKASKAAYAASKAIGRQLVAFDNAAMSK